MAAKGKKGGHALFPKRMPQSERRFISARLKALSWADRANAEAMLAKYFAGKTTGAQDAKLKRLGVLPGTEPEELDQRELAKNWVVLAAALTRRFAGRVSCDISAAQISKWKAGGLSDKGIPLPPMGDGKKIVVDDWASWFERWVMPLPGWTPENQAKPSLAQRAQDARNLEDIDRHRLIQIELHAAEGKYRPADDFLKFCDRLRLVFQESVVQSVERNAAERIKATLAGLGLSADQRQFAEAAVAQAARQAADDVLSAWSVEMRKIGEEIKTEK